MPYTTIFATASQPPIYKAFMTYAQKLLANKADFNRHDRFLHKINYVSNVYISSDFNKKHNQLSHLLKEALTCKPEVVASKMRAMNELISELLSELSTPISFLGQPIYSKLFIKYLITYAQYKIDLDAAKNYDEAAKLVEPVLLTLFINFPLTNRIDYILSVLRKNDFLPTLLSEEVSFDTKLNLILNHPKCNEIYQDFEKAREDLLTLLQDESKFLEDIGQNLTNILNEHTALATPAP